jgi:hypothetical protein
MFRFKSSLFFSLDYVCYFYHAFIGGLKREVVYQINKYQLLLRILLNNELILVKNLRVVVIDLDINYIK